MKDLYCLIYNQLGDTAICIFNYKKIIISSRPDISKLQRTVFSEGNGFLIPTSGYSYTPISINHNLKSFIHNTIYEVDSLYLKNTMRGTGLYCSGETVGRYTSRYSEHVNLVSYKDNYIKEVFIRARPVPFQLLKEKLTEFQEIP